MLEGLISKAGLEVEQLLVLSILLGVAFLLPETCGAKTPVLMELQEHLIVAQK